MRQYLKLLSLTCGTLALISCGGDETGSSSNQLANKAVATNTTATPMTPIERGEKVYRRCIACHTLGEGEKHKVGPNLYGVFGQVAGSRDDFNYSKAMKASEIVWTDETMDAYLIKPRDYIPGNRMSYVGLKKAEDRAAVIAYMKQETQ